MLDLLPFTRFSFSHYCQLLFKLSIPSSYRGDRRNDRRNFKLSELYPTSTPHHTTNMSRIEEALAAIESLDEGEHFMYTNIANTYGVSRVTLARRHQGIQASRTEQAVKQ
jgi:hypothetical protein